MDQKSSNWILTVSLYLAGSLALVSALVRLAGVGDVVLTGSSADPDDIHYASHLLLTLLHLIPGVLFLLLGPLQFVASIRNTWPQWHRWSGRIVVISGFLAAGTALVMNAIFPPVGGLFKSLAVYIFATAQIIALIIAFRAILLKRIQQHKIWMIRAFALGLSISTMRAFFIPYFIIVGMPSDFVIGLGMWIGFVINILVGELIVARLKHNTH